MMKTQKTKNLKRSILSITLVLALLITGAFAFLTSTDSKTNVFTIGNVKIQLTEEFDINQDGTIDQETERFINTDPQNTPVQNILPGQQIIKRPYVKNTGSNAAWVYMAIGIPTASNDNTTYSSTGELAIANTDVTIPIKAFAIQDGYSNIQNDSVAIWNAFLENENTKAKFFNTPRLETPYQSELFFIYNNNNTIFDANQEWQPLNKYTPYKSSDGHNYYFFAYKTILAPGTSTTSLIEKVRLTEDIGEPIFFYTQSILEEPSMLITTDSYFNFTNGATAIEKDGINYVVGIPQYTKDTDLSNFIEHSTDVVIQILATPDNSYIGTGYKISVSSEESPETTDYIVLLYGDIDGNGIIENRDSRMLQYAISGHDDLLSETQLLAANIYGSRKTVNMQDVDTLKGVIAGQYHINQLTGKVDEL